MCPQEELDTVTACPTDSRNVALTLVAVLESTVLLRIPDTLKLK
jgi:hypothetical protein